MSKVLWMSNSGECLPIAWRMAQEGTDVGVYLHTPRYRRNYDGLVDKVSMAGLKKAIKAAEIIIFDITRPNNQTREDLLLLKLFGLKSSSRSVFGPIADKLKKDAPVIGCSEWSEEIELNRTLGATIAGKIGLANSENHDFKALAEGVKFLQGRKDHWVLKPHDNADLDLTYVEAFPGELAAMMQRVLPGRVGEKFKYMLQRRVEGVEVSSEGWWDGSRWVHFNHTIEDKRLMTGDKGLAVGSATNVVWVRGYDGFLTDQFERLSPYLRRAGYIGPVDINAIVGDEDHLPYFLEFSPRFGWDAAYCLMSLLEGNLTDFFYNGFRGRFNPGFAASVRVSIPPYPYSNKDLLDNLAKGAMVHHTPGQLKGVWLEDVTLDESGNLVCAGSDGILGVVTGTGASVGEAVGKVYEQAKRIKVSAKVQYRIDCGKRAERAISTFNRWGIPVRTVPPPAGAHYGRGPDPAVSAGPGERPAVAS